MCRRRNVQRPWEIIELLAYCQANDQKRFFKELPIITEITLTLMTWKAKSDTTHCGCLCPAGAVAPSFTCWLTGQLFSGGDPRNSSYTVCVLLCPQKSEKNQKSFYSYRIRIYLYRIRGYLWLLTPQKLFIHVGYELLTPNWELMMTIDLRKHSYRIRIYLYRVWNTEILIPDPKLFVSVDSTEGFIHIRSSLLPNYIC